jgi:polar amino acid transport system permease protein
MNVLSDYFRDLAERSPRWDFIWLYDSSAADRILSGLYVTLQLSVICVLASLLIGFAGSLLQTSRYRVARLFVNGYLQVFRNTPPLVQLLFFYFALGQFTPTYSPDGWTQIPLISNIGWAAIALSLFGAAFNVEIFRAGLEAVPASTTEAAESLGMSRWLIFSEIQFPLALRVCLPALSGNLINLVKTTSQAFAIAVPELLYQSASLWNDHPATQNPTMLLLLVVYVSLVGLLSLCLRFLERRMKVPGYGD